MIFFNTDIWTHKLNTKQITPLLYMGKGAKFIYPKKLVVIIGKPIPVPASVDGRMPRSAVKEVTTQLHEQLQQLFDEAQTQAGYAAK